MIAQVFRPLRCGIGVVALLALGLLEAGGGGGEEEQQEQAKELCECLEADLRATCLEAAAEYYESFQA